jgi:hypothetical protein
LRPSTRCWPSSAGATAENNGARKPVVAVPLPPRALFAGKRERLDTPARAALLGVLVMDGDDDVVDGHA